MRELLDKTHYYVEIDEKSIWNELNNTKRVVGYLLLDVTNIEDILEPINLAKKHKSIIEVEIADRENYRRMCDLLCNGHLFSRILKYRDFTLKIIYNKSYTYNLDKLGDFLFLKFNKGEWELKKSFDVDINVNMNDTLNSLRNKLNMLGINNQHIEILGNNTVIEIRDKKDDANYINRIIDKSSFVSLIYSHTMNNTNIDISSHKIYELGINSLCNKLDNLNLPNGKFLILTGVGVFLTHGELKFNCNTWIVGGSYAPSISANKYMNTRYIKYLYNVELHSTYELQDNSNVLDLRGLEENIVFESVCLLGFDTILINACDESNIVGNNSINFLDTRVIISNNMNISKSVVNLEGVTRLYMNKDLKSDLEDFEKFELNKKFNRVATEDERKLYEGQVQ